MNVTLFVALNALNLADAALTRTAIHLGIAEEGNPLVLLMGWDVKVFGVLVLSGLVYLLRPTWLSVPVLAYSTVVMFTAVSMLGTLGG